jgi:PIN domain nuclease of toxin-antitoxin system
LLDTNIVLWASADPEKLSAAARAAIRRGPLTASVVSHWEIVIKAGKGLIGMGDPNAWWERAVELLAARTLPVRSNHVAALYSLPPHHKDPFDRMLIAQCAAEGMALVTSDAEVRRYSIPAVW